MSITYSGGPIQSVLFTSVTGTKQELIDQIETVLLAASWTTVSGHGTTNLLMQSAATPAPQNLQMRLNIKGTNTNCVSLSILNVAGTKVSGNDATHGLMLLPSIGKTWRIWADPFQMFATTGIVTQAREFVMCGVPALPPFLHGVVTEAMWGVGNAQSDTDTTIRTSWRTVFNSLDPGNWCSNYQVICNGNIWECANNSQNGNLYGSLQLVSMGSMVNTSPQAYLFHDDSAVYVDPLIAWGTTGPADVAKIRGQLWDAVICSEAYSGDVTTSFDGHNWITLTHNNVGGGTCLRGTLIMATA